MDIDIRELAKSTDASEHWLVRTIVDPASHNGVVIWTADPGSAMVVDFAGNWTPNVGGGDDYYDALGDRNAKRHDANKYQVVLKLSYIRVGDRDNVHSTDWFPFTGRPMQFGPYDSWLVELSARMNDARKWDDNANDKANPMTALILKTRF